MKKQMKRLLSLLFAVMLVMSMFAVPASALNSNQVEMDVTYLDKVKCWTEAAKYMSVTGLSRPRIAAELYAHAMADNVGYKNRDNWFLSDLWQYLVDHGHVVEIGGDADWRVNMYYWVWNAWDTNNDNTYYYLHSALNWGKVIDVSGNSDNNGTKIQLYDQNYTDAQQFGLYPSGEDNWYYIFKKNTFKCLDVTNGEAGDGVKVQLYDYNGTDAQKWGFIRDNEGYYYIINRLGYYLDACGGSTNNGTQIWTYTLNYTNAQRWGLSLA